MAFHFKQNDKINILLVEPEEGRSSFGSKQPEIVIVSIKRFRFNLHDCSLTSLPKVILFE